MSKSQEQLDEEFMLSIRDTVDEMFEKMFPLKMFCEVEEDIEDVVDEEKNDDQE